MTNMDDLRNMFKDSIFIHQWSSKGFESSFNKKTHESVCDDMKRTPWGVAVCNVMNYSR